MSPLVKHHQLTMEVSKRVTEIKRPIIQHTTQPDIATPNPSEQI